MGDEVSILVNEGNDGSTSTGKHGWVVEINDKLSKMEHSPQTDPSINKNCTIYRRPVNVQEEQDSNFLYRPRIVSFGPYHHDDECCQQTNKIKELALLHYLKSSGKGIHDYVDALREDVKNLKEAYNKLEPKWEQDEDAFLRLMVFDGCFLLHILREGNNLDHLSHELLAVYEISPNELIEYYKHDMLLLENQLPMQLLEKLLLVRNDSSIEEAQEGLYELILRFIVPSSPNIAENLPRQKGQRMYLHVLDLYRHSLLLYHDQHEGKSGSQTPLEARIPLVFLIKELLSSNKCVVIVSFLFLPIYFFAGALLALPLFVIFLIILLLLAAIRSSTFIMYMIIPAGDVWFIIPSATELKKAGIGLLMKRTKRLENISFAGEVLHLRQIYVDGATNSRLLNIIAFERLHTDAENTVTSYIYFMSRLLQAADDVRLLQLRQIIRTMLHTNEVVQIFKSLTNDVNMHDPNISLDENCRDVGKRLSWCFHYKMREVFGPNFWQTFATSSRAFYSFIGAIILFGLAIVQTVYIYCSELQQFQINSCSNVRSISMSKEMLKNDSS